MMKLPLKTEWARLRDAVDRIESQINRSEFPLPTLQMCELLILGEDHRFYLHPGVDPIALCRAIWKTFVCGNRQGASTIAMQLVRTITGRYERTWRRKLLEIIFAFRLTHYLDRDRLPILYLWVAYYGWRMNNFRQACSRLQIKPNLIDEMEAAKLVARLKYPEPYQHNIRRIRQIQRRGEHLIALKTQTDSNGTIQDCKATIKAH
jgi:membrane peptidoglycan carboxypeptidase